MLAGNEGKHDMPIAKITKRSVDEVAPGEKIIVLWDTDLAGFGLKIMPTGRKVYLVQYRAGGRRSPSQRVTIGTHGPLTAEDARKLAKTLLAQVRLGKDPAAERRRRRRENTISELADRYLSEHVERHNKPATAKEVKRIVEKRIKPKLGRVKISDLSRSAIKAWHHEKADRPYEANRELAYLSKMMALAAGEWELRTDNPCRGIRKFPEAKRERFFSDDELKRIGAALDEAEQTNATFPGCINAVRLLAMTGMRLGEVLGLRWDYVDLAAGVVRLPDAKAGARTVPMGLPAKLLLGRISKTGDHVCHGKNTKLPLDKSTLHKLWRTIKAKAKLGDARPHDFRHTTGTFAAQAGSNAFMIRDLLGHKTIAMTSRYVERAPDPLRATADAVASRVAAAMDGATAEVAQIEEWREQPERKTIPR
jgi:integrase